jgi:hypothetical protein
VALTATDESGGSGVKEIHFALSGAQTGSKVVSGSDAAVLISSEGTTTLTYFAVDNAGNQEAPKTITVRIDRTQPVISGLPAAGCTLWPPDHRLVTVASVTVSDSRSGLAPGSLVVTGVSSEPENGLGDGDTAPDIVIVGGTVQLRAERAGTGPGESTRSPPPRRTWPGIWRRRRRPASCRTTGNRPAGIAPGGGGVASRTSNRRRRRHGSWAQMGMRRLASRSTATPRTGPRGRPWLGDLGRLCLRLQRPIMRDYVTLRRSSDGAVAAEGVHVDYAHALRSVRVDYASVVRSVEARVEDRERFLQHLRRGLPDSPGLARPEVDRLDLLDHDEAGDGLAFRDRHMKGVVAAGVCDRTRNAKPRVSVEEVVADHEGGTTPALLVT